MWSKFFELVDTVFLVLRKRDVIFLHWYHHVTVLLYCWHGLANRVANVFWFSTMNYSVHAIMYSYYFFMGFDMTRRIVRPFALFITSLQILQMVGGLIILAVTYSEQHRPASAAEIATGAPATCHANEDSMFYGVLMYSSYFALFCHFFFRTYIVKGKAKSQSASNGSRKSK